MVFKEDFVRSLIKTGRVPKPLVKDYFDEINLNTELHEEVKSLKNLREKKISLFEREYEFYHKQVKQNRKRI